MLTSAEVCFVSISLVAFKTGSPIKAFRTESVTKEAGCVLLIISIVAIAVVRDVS